MTSARAAAGRLHRVPAGGLTLARYGYVEEAPGGRGRQRPWQVVHRSNTIPGDELGADAKLAAGALLQLIRERDRQRLQTYESMRADYPKQWREAAHEMRLLVHLTAAELAELFGAIESVLEPYLEKVERRARCRSRSPARGPDPPSVRRGPGGPVMRSVLKDRNLRILLGADALSLLGSSALWLALGIWVKSLTGSTAAAGMVIFAILAPPVLLAPAAGMLVDRVRRRPLLITVNLLSAAAVLLLLLVRDAGQVWLVYAVGAAYGTSCALLRSGQSALLRTVAADDEKLLAANGALQTVAALSRLLSPVAGAGLYAALGPHSVVLLDAASFLVGAAGLALLRICEPAPVPAEGYWRAEIGAGLAHLRRTLVLRQIVTAVALAMLVIGFIEVVMFAIVDQGLHRSPAFLGVLDLGFGAGSVAGGLLAPPRSGGWGRERPSPPGWSRSRPGWR